MAERTETPIDRGSLPEWAAAQVADTTHPVIEDEKGVYRYKQNRLIRWLVDNGVSLNDMWIAYHNGAFSRDEFRQFYRDTGYSLDGFADVWVDDDEDEA